LSSLLACTLESVVAVDKFPKAVLDIFVMVLQVNRAVTAQQRGVPCVGWHACTARLAACGACSRARLPACAHLSAAQPALAHGQAAAPLPPCAARAVRPALRTARRTAGSCRLPCAPPARRSPTPASRCWTCCPPAPWCARRRAVCAARQGPGSARPQVPCVR
jgi:hypothetical protein